MSSLMYPTPDTRTVSTPSTVFSASLGLAKDLGISRENAPLGFITEDGLFQILMEDFTPFLMEVKINEY